MNKTKIDRISQAVAKRQLILDVMAGKRELSTTWVANALGWKTDPVNRLMADMVEMGELVKTGEWRTARYTAVAVTTKSADAIRARLAVGGYKVGKTNAGRQQDFPKHESGWKNGRYTNNPCKHNPVRNPDAMGSRGVAWGVCSSLGGGMFGVVM